MEALATHSCPDRVPLCGSCHDVIGVYEPLVRVFQGCVSHTSRAAEPLPQRSGERWYHLGCYQSLDEEH
jgi:hypothetical protein